MKTAIRLLFILLCLCGIALSAVSLYNHYAVAATEYCDFGQTFNCDIVNRSRYSVFLGLPVALIGLCGYAALLGLTLSGNRWARIARFGFAILGFAYSLRLTWIEARVLGTWCVLCLGSLLAIAGILLLSAIDLRDSPKSIPEHPGVRDASLNELG